MELEGAKELKTLTPKKALLWLVPKVLSLDIKLRPLVCVVANEGEALPSQGLESGLKANI